MKRYNNQTLIIGSYVLELDGVSEIGYRIPGKTWLDVVIKTKNDIPTNLISSETQIFYVLKDNSLFHIKPHHVEIENNVITIVPTSCGLLIQNTNGSI